MVKRNRRRPRLKVTGDGTGVVNHVGTRLVADLADRIGLTSALSAAMAPTKQRRRGHDRGEVLVDVAVMLADGGDTISDVAVLRNQPDLFGEVASHPTVWRTLEAVDDQTLERIKSARAHGDSHSQSQPARPLQRYANTATHPQSLNQAPTGSKARAGHSVPSPFTIAHHLRESRRRSRPDVRSEVMVR